MIDLKLSLTIDQLDRVRKLLRDEESFLDNRLDRLSAVDRERGRRELVEIMSISEEIDYALEKE